MEKVEAIQYLCSDLMFCPVIFNQDIATHRMVSAGLIEHDIPRAGAMTGSIGEPGMVFYRLVEQPVKTGPLPYIKIVERKHYMERVLALNGYPPYNDRRKSYSMAINHHFWRFRWY